MYHFSEHEGFFLACDVALCSCFVAGVYGYGGTQSLDSACGTGFLGESFWDTAWV
jgi:hypothetical protein